MKRTYEEEANKLAQAIDIAIEAFQKYPPKNFQQEHVNQFVDTYLDYKNKTLNPEPQFRKLASLKYKTQDVFIFFQESSGDAVDFFWKELKKNNLPFQRENKLLKIVSKKKIKNDAEYDYVIDTIVPFEQEGIITKEDVNTLNQLISDFENKGKK